MSESKIAKIIFLFSFCFRFDSGASFLRRGFYIRYKTNAFNQLVRKQQFDTLDFLSFTGGILGLFAGFSALSFIELIYWFTIRIFVLNYKKGDARIHPITDNEGTNSKASKSVLNNCRSYINESSVHGFSHIFEISRAVR